MSKAEVLNEIKRLVAEWSNDAYYEDLHLIEDIDKTLRLEVSDE